MKIPHVSPSRLKKALECQFQYFLSYEWFWADELFTYTFCSEFGTTVHETLEEYVTAKGEIDYKKVYAEKIAEYKPFADDMGKAPSKARASFFIDKDCANCPHFDSGTAHCGIMPMHVEEDEEEITSQHVNNFNGCPKKLYDEGLAMVELAIDRYSKYFKTGIKNEDNPGGKVIGVEAEANVSWGSDVEGKDIKMKGFIDLVVEYDEETLLVVDYKTGYSVPEHEKFIKDLQPRMYSYAAKIMYPEYKYHWVQFDYFRGIPMEHAFTDDDDEQTRQQVVGLYNKISKARSIKRRGEDWYCKYLCNRPFCDQKWEELLAGVDGSNPEKKDGR